MFRGYAYMKGEAVDEEVHRVKEKMIGRRQPVNPASASVDGMEIVPAVD